MDNLHDPIVIPDAIPPLVGFNEMLTPLVQSLVQEGNFALRAAHLYDRKGYDTLDGFAQPQNPSYRREGDDVVLQVTVQIPASHAGYGLLQGVYLAAQEKRSEQRRQALQLTVDRAQEALEAAQKALAEEANRRRTN